MASLFNEQIGMTVEVTVRWRENGRGNRALQVPGSKSVPTQPDKADCDEHQTRWGSDGHRLDPAETGENTVARCKALHHLPQQWEHHGTRVRSLFLSMNKPSA
jgi:hypothetical protein